MNRPLAAVLLFATMVSCAAPRARVDRGAPEPAQAGAVQPQPGPAPSTIDPSGQMAAQPATQPSPQPVTQRSAPVTLATKAPPDDAARTGSASAPLPTPTATPTPTPAPNATATAEQDDQPPAPRRPSLVAGSLAPDFTLSDASGANPVALRSLRGKPTVLVFGSCTCPPFVRSTRATGALYQRYRGRVNFLMVYGREAHPTDGWAIEGNRFKVTQPTTIEERRAAARGFVKELGIAMPLVVDTIEGDAERLYDPFPNRVVVIDAEGRIAHIGARGPQSTLNSAREVPAVLDGLLAPR